MVLDPEEDEKMTEESKKKLINGVREYLGTEFEVFFPRLINTVEQSRNPWLSYREGIKRDRYFVSK